jgi:hypothetical protein
VNQELFQLIADQTEAIEKQAFLGAALRLGGTLLKSVGGAIVKSPMAALGTAASAAFTGSDLASGTKKFTAMANKNPSNPFT